MCPNPNVCQQLPNDEEEISFPSNMSPTSVINSNESSPKWKDNKDEKSSQLPAFIEIMNPSQQFMVLAFGMFFFFGIHNLLQEGIMKVPGFEHGVMLSYMEVLGVSFCSYFERKYVAKETVRVAPLSSYPVLTLCLMGSSALSNMSLDYINFPTKVVFRSCKLIPTMIIATIINRRVFKSIEYASAFAISIGLVIFAAADWKLTPSFNPTGITLVSISVIADAILPNIQERNFRLGASRLEVTFYTNFFTLITMTITTIWSGDLFSLIQLARFDQHLAVFMMVYTAISYVAISLFMTIVKKYGGVTAVLLGTARKAMSLILSFLFFPKAFSWYYVLGATLVLGGLLVVSLTKHLGKTENHQYEAVEQTQDEEMAPPPPPPR